MISKVFTIATTWALLAGASNSPKGASEDMIRPTDPDIAVAEEYRNFKAEGTREALELFIARHSDHPLADQAREDIRRIGERIDQ